MSAKMTRRERERLHQLLLLLSETTTDQHVKTKAEMLAHDVVWED